MKVVLALSGGLDSSTLLAEFQKDIELCVFADYGSKQNEREWSSAQLIASHYGKKLIKLDLKQSFSSFKSALLSHSDEEVEEGPYSIKEESNAKVPFRNGIFASYLVGLAESFNLDGIVLGVHSGDHRLYPDCSPDFVDSLSLLVKRYSGGAIQVFTPYLHITKRDIANKAAKFGLPVQYTYSCYKGGDYHCGKCPTCLERQDAMGLFWNEGGKI